MLGAYTFATALIFFAGEEPSTEVPEQASLGTMSSHVLGELGAPSSAMGASTFLSLQFIDSNEEPFDILFHDGYAIFVARP